MPKTPMPKTPDTSVINRHQTPKPKTPAALPLIIVGNGLTGLITALTLAQAGYEISLIGKNEGGRPSGSQRTITLNPRSMDWLKKLGIRQWLIDNNRPCTVITTIAVATDEEKNTNVLEWQAGLPETDPPESDPPESDPPESNPLGFVIREDDLLAAAWAKTAAHRLITSWHGITITGFEPAAQGHHYAAAGLTDSTGKKWYARLILACDGTQSPLRQMARITTLSRTPKQTALIADIDLEYPHNHTAWQRFMAGGPIALMPLANPHRASMVWTMPDATAASLMQCGQDQFNQTLNDKALSPFGTLSLASTLLSWRLQLHDTPKPWGERLVLLGDAAHAIHPLAGQGFNLSIGDSIALGSALAWAEKHGVDIGAAATLKRFAHSRRLEVIAMTAATDGLNHVFSFAPKPLVKTAHLAMRVFNHSPLKALAQELASGRFTRLA